MDFFKTKPAIVKSLKTVGVSKTDADAYVVHAQPTVFFVGELTPDEQITIGASKLSGQPDLAAGQDWPMRPVYDNVDARIEELEKMIAKADLGVFSYISEAANAQIKAESAARLDTLKQPFPLFFLGQVNFAEVAAQNPPLGDEMPTRGVLSVFYDVLEMPWGFDPADKAGFRLVWSPDGAGLTRRETPAAMAEFIEADYQNQLVAAKQAEELQRQRSKVGFIAKLFGAEDAEPDFIPTPARLEAASQVLIPTGGYTLPNYWEVLPRLEPNLIRDNGAVWEEWWDYANAFYADLQVGGWANNIQSADMGLEAQLVSNGVYVGDASGYDSALGQELAKGADDWMLLMQIDSMDNGWVWGDGGMLYVWIRRADLAARDFDKSWCILQTT